MKKPERKTGGKILRVLFLIAGILTASIVYAHDKNMSHKHIYDNNTGKANGDDYYETMFGKVIARTHHRVDGTLEQRDIYDMASGKVKLRWYHRADSTLERADSYELATDKLELITYYRGDETRELTEFYDLATGKVKGRIYFASDGETIIREEKISK